MKCDSDERSPLFIMRMLKRVENGFGVRRAVRMFVRVVLAIVAFNCGFVAVVEAAGTTGLVKETENQLLLLSTLDGYFVCIERATGVVRWKLQEEPVIRLPTSSDKPKTPIFLPDPKDGSLYMLNSNDRETLSKLPFTIPQLVASSPCRSSDGIIFTGKKLDTWFTVNPESGAKRSFLTYNSIDLTCPREGSDIYIGRTEYNIVMVDPHEKDRAWNVTFYDYLSFSMDSESRNKYNLLHFTGSSSGRIATLDRETGSLIWQLNFESPIVDIYALETRGLLKVPFRSVAESTLDQLTEGGNLRKNSKFGIEFKTSELKLFPTLYIGECENGLYALPALVDETTATIALAQNGPLLLEGPAYSSDDSQRLDANADEAGDEGQSSEAKNKLFEMKDFAFSKGTAKDTAGKSVVILLGHYKVPETNGKAVLQIEGKSGENESKAFDSSKATGSGRQNVAAAVDAAAATSSTRKTRLYNVVVELASGNASASHMKEFVWLTLTIVKFFVVEQENLEIKVAMFALVVVVFSLAWYFNKQMRDIQQLSQSSKSRDSNLGAGVTAVPEDLGFGVVKVGKIEFNPDEILGKGCEGTFVFKGKFDSRLVAVKRVLPECFTFADREVELLRESDHHPNVVRYYCMEQDKQFRYIALELCAATLQDYIEDRFKAEGITPIQIMEQAICGLKHLHSLSIVHRDIKPHNVLLSVSSGKSEVRAMISDFGLCKKLKYGRASFSRRSGITGTDGWIAPEMLSGETRTTCAVDIFSMGCVFYYVLTRGKHPFGDALHRQANILSGDYDLGHLGDDQLAGLLVRQMIDFEPRNRPTAGAVLLYPIFWTGSRVLSFFQDVSDRIEKEDADDAVLRRLEENGRGVVRGDWRFQMDAEVAKDLRKFRNYHGDRVRDLLRALRNKKHHYRELSEQAQKNLGDIPENFVAYWTTRFPLLLIHTWLAMQCVKFEPVFSGYYDSNYTFLDLPKTDYCNYEIKSDDFVVNSNGWLNGDNLKRNSPAGRSGKGNNNNNHIGGHGISNFGGTGCSKAESDLNWRLREDGAEDDGDNDDGGGKRRTSEFECTWADVEKSSLDFKNVFFQKWMKSDFRDDESFARWQEAESERGGQVDGGESRSEDHVLLVSEPPSWHLRDRFRSLVLGHPQFFDYHRSPRKHNRSRKHFQRRPSKKQGEKISWAVTS